MKKKVLWLLLAAALAMLLPTGCGRQQEAAERPPIEAARIAVMLGSVGENFCQTHYPDATLLQFNNFSDSIAALQGGKADYAMMSFSNASNFCRYNDDLAYLPDQLTTESYALAFAKDSPELRDKASAVIQQMLDDGTMETIIGHWMRTDGSDSVVEDIPRIENGPVLRVAMSPNFEPVCFVKDNEYVGLDVEVVLRVAYELGMTVEFQSMQFAAEITSLQSGRSDVAISVTATEERAKSVDFSPGYFPNPQMLVVRDEAAAEPASLSGFWAGLKTSFERTLVEEERWRLIVRGLGVTLLISAAAFVLGSLLGALVCLLRRSKKPVLRGLSSAYIAIMQGIPILVLLMILYYIVFSKAALAAVTVAIIGFSLYFAGYSAEIFRSGLNSVEKGQIEASLALGFGKYKTFWLITLPQAMRQVLPVFKGEFITIVKMTSVVGYIAIEDLTKISDIIRSRTYEAFFPLILTAVIYFLITYVLVIALRSLERRIDPAHRKRVVKGVTMK